MRLERLRPSTLSFPSALNTTAKYGNPDADEPYTWPYIISSQLAIFQKPFACSIPSLDLFTIM